MRPDYKNTVDLITDWRLSIAVNVQLYSHERDMWVIDVITYYRNCCTLVFCMFVDEREPLFTWKLRAEAVNPGEFDLHKTDLHSAVPADSDSGQIS